MAAHDKRPYYLSYKPEKMAELLDGTKWADEFSWEELLVFANYTEVLRPSAGTTLFEEGDKERFLAIVVSGEVDIYKKEPDGKKRHLAVLTSPRTIGEMAMIDGEPRSAEARARTEVTLLAVNKKNFEQLAEQKPVIALRILSKISKILSRRLRRTSGMLVENYYHDEY